MVCALLLADAEIEWGGACIFLRLTLYNPVLNQVFLEEITNDRLFPDIKLVPDAASEMNIKAAFLHAYLVQVPLSISPSATKAPFNLDLSVSVKIWRPLM